MSEAWADEFFEKVNGEHNACAYRNDCQTAHYDITRLQPGVERLRGRCGELESAVIDVSCCRSEDEDHFLVKAIQVAREGNSSAWLLRKQAEAVEVISKEYKCGMEAEDMVSALKDYAQSLRNQADELESK